jgi:hypothetical protein
VLGCSASDRQITDGNREFLFYLSDRKHRATDACYWQAQMTINFLDWPTSEVLIALQRDSAPTGADAFLEEITLGIQKPQGNPRRDCISLSKGKR